MATTEPDPVADSGHTRRWLLDAARSSVEFRVPHLWGLMTVVGRFDRFDGSYDGRTMGLTVDAASLETGHRKRDERLRSADFFDVESHPQISFRSTSVTEASAGTLRVVGELEAAGKRVQLGFDAIVRADGEELEIESETTVEQRLFGMTWSPLGTVRSPATLHVRARLTPQWGGDEVGYRPHADRRSHRDVVVTSTVRPATKRGSTMADAANSNRQRRLVRLDDGDGDMYVVEDGLPDAPAVLLLGNAAVSTACWDPVIPTLSDAFHVIRVEQLVRRRSTSPRGGYDIPTVARRVAVALDRLGVSRATVIGHSSGCTVATALAEERPDAVAGLVLISMGPSPDAKLPEPLLVRLSLTHFPGRLLWRLRTKATIRKAARTAFTRPVSIPDAFVAHVSNITHTDFVGSMRSPLDYLRQRSLPDRLTSLGLPLLVVFGTDDRRWRSSSAAEYRVVPGARVEMLPGVGHTPMMEDPLNTSTLLLHFCCSGRAA